MSFIFVERIFKFINYFDAHPTGWKRIVSNRGCFFLYLHGSGRSLCSGWKSCPSNSQCVQPKWHISARPHHKWSLLNVIRSSIDCPRIQWSHGHLPGTAFAAAPSISQGYIYFNRPLPWNRLPINLQSIESIEF